MDKERKEMERVGKKKTTEDIDENEKEKIRKGRN